MNNDLILRLVVASGVIAALYGWMETQTITRASAGSDRMKEIAAAIHEGARAYLNRQYSTISMVGVASSSRGAEAGIPIAESRCGILHAMHRRCR